MSTRRRPAEASAIEAAGKPPHRSPVKTGKILGAARDLFTETGYGATSMDAVAAAAGVSKATVYSHFGSKPELFAAVILQEGQTSFAIPDLETGDGIEPALRQIARDAFYLVLAPTTTAFFRMIAAEVPRFPELGKIFYESGPASVQARVAAFLSSAMDRGELRRADPVMAATQFFALICGDLQLRDVMGTGGQISKKRREDVLERGIDSFLRAYRPEAMAQTAGPVTLRNGKRPMRTSLTSK